MTQQYLGFIEQTLHYFDRPHDSVADAPVQSEAAWRGDSLAPLEQLAYHLSPAEQAELQQAVNHAQSLGRETRELSAADFPLPTLAEKFRA